MSSFTHFKYVCRFCKKEINQPILIENPAATAIPTCCGNRRDMAFKAPVVIGEKS